MRVEYYKYCYYTFDQSAVDSKSLLYDCCLVTALVGVVPRRASDNFEHRGVSKVEDDATVLFLCLRRITHTLLLRLIRKLI